MKVEIGRRYTPAEPDLFVHIGDVAHHGGVVEIAFLHSPTNLDVGDECPSPTHPQDQPTTLERWENSGWPHCRHCGLTFSPFVHRQVPTRITVDANALDATVAQMMREAAAPKAE